MRARFYFAIVFLTHHFGRILIYTFNMAVRGVNNLPIREFKYGMDWDEYVPEYEESVGLSHNVEAGSDRDKFCMKWLKLKMDDAAKAILNEAKETTWAKLKEELSLLFVDQQEKYDWLANRRTIKWDGQESFHQLANRIKRAVDKYDPKGAKQQEYFLRFRLALGPEYRKAIDLGCDDFKLEEAKKIASRVRLAMSDAESTKQDEAKSVAFAGAAMSSASIDPNRLKTAELNIQGLAVRLDDIESEKKSSERRDSRDDSRDRRDPRFRDYRSPSRDRYSRDSSRGGRDDRRGGRSRDRYQAYGGGYSPSPGRRDGFDRGRRDSYDRRRDYDRRDYDSRDRGRRDYSYGRSPSGYRGRSPSQGRYDSRDRYDRSRGRYDRSRDRFDSRDRYPRERRDDRRPDSRDRRYDDRRDFRRDDDRRGDGRDRRYEDRDRRGGDRDRRDGDRQNQGDRDRGRDEDPGNQVALRNPGNNYRAAEYDDEQIDRLSNAVALRLRTNDQGN